MVRYRYKVPQITAVQVVPNGDILLRLTCGHMIAWLGYVNTGNPNRWATLDETDARALIGHAQRCIICGGDFGTEAQGIVIRDRRACGGDTFIEAGRTWSRPCARCHRPLDVPGILSAIAAHPFPTEAQVTAPIVDHLVAVGERGLWVRRFSEQRPYGWEYLGVIVREQIIGQRTIWLRVQRLDTGEVCKAVAHRVYGEEMARRTHPTEAQAIWGRNPKRGNEP